MVFVLLPVVVLSQCPFAAQFKEIDRNHEQQSDKLEVPLEDSVRSCSKLKYRSYNGYCNNLKVPTRGMAYSYYARLIPSDESRNQSALPLPKMISEKLYPNKPITDKDYSLASMQYGQVVAHDISDRIMPLVNGNRQKTTVTSYLDLSVIYGNNKEVADHVRVFKEGLLKTEMRNGQEFPELLKKPTIGDNCSDMREPGESCYDVGDTRANQNPQLAMMHILFMREHNRIARKLLQLNPNWTDEKVYQEARKINIAQHQHIAFYQYLPIVLGRKNMLEKKIIYDANGYIDDYNEDVDATALDEHGNAAFRYYHTQIAGHLKLITDTHDSTGDLRISDYIGRPQIIEKGDNFYMLGRGLAFQQSMGVDNYHDDEHVQSLKELFDHHDDVDLTVGGSLEKHVPGTWAGPTFHCILMKQFYNTRVGDRYWYEHSGELGFTLEQLNEIRKSSLSKILCGNANITKIQKDIFTFPTLELIRKQIVRRYLQ
ncbi:unnamed protein product [Acanthoscelides obtectus]|uniref:Peroxidase n=1 Tax=Acanthoscelides obtectus TaxID=200917 RepID=A0A9P0MFP7_ACAOB|nr:unnamed protein product [Acanthoscelides obtectus]CAK1674075.1 Peroxidase [Acanthoscelides obtectus]